MTERNRRLISRYAIRPEVRPAKPKTGGEPVAEDKPEPVAWMVVCDDGQLFAVGEEARAALARASGVAPVPLYALPGVECEWGVREVAPNGAVTDHYGYAEDMARIRAGWLNADGWRSCVIRRIVGPWEGVPRG